ncbi:MAG: hypothetical protein AAGJ50_15630, partial [Pseudomonadota bacterium]
MSRTGESPIPDYPVLENPYRWLDWPVADVAIDASAGASSRVENRIDLEAAGDFLKATARLRTVNGNDDRFEDTLRFTLSRSSAEAKELGPLKARQVAVGDIATPSLALLSPSRTGAGFIVTNRSALSADMFDSTEIRGPLPNGWEAELYEGEQLVGFVTDPDPNGDYVFEGVVLRPGFNRFEVRLFGPFGETEVREIKQFVGADLTPENEVTYAFGFVDADRRLVGKAERQFNAQDEDRPPEGRLVHASISTGLTQHLTAAFDGQIGLDEAAGSETGGTASLFASVFGGYGALRVASDGGGAPAIQTLLQRRLGARSSLSATYINFGDLSTGLLGQESGQIRQAGRVRVNTVFGIRQYQVPFQSEIEWQDFEGGLSRVDAATRISTAFRRLRLTNSLQVSRLSNGTSSSTTVPGEVLLAGSLKGLRLRGSFGYQLHDGPALTSASLAAQRQVGRDRFAQAAITHDFFSGETSANMSWSRTFRRAALSFNGSLDASG